MRTLLVALWLIVLCTACSPRTVMESGGTPLGGPSPVLTTTPVDPVGVSLLDLTCATRDVKVREYLLAGGLRNTIINIPGTSYPDDVPKKVFLQDNGSTLGAAWFDYPNRWCQDDTRPGLAYEEERCTTPKWPYPCANVEVR